MDLFDYIYKRKSCRKYILEHLSSDVLKEIESKLENFELLFKDVPISYRFVSETKGMFHVLAPHYLVFSGVGKDGEQENVGFIGQQLMLWLNSQNIGGVWLGASRDISSDHSSSDIVIIAFGRSDESIFRDTSEFRRKDIAEISNIADNAFIQAAHLAPSGLNLQPWYFNKVDDKLLIYQEIIKPPKSLLYKLTKVDIGIVLAHLYITSKHLKKDFKFYTTDLNKDMKGYKYFGYIDLKEDIYD